MFASDTRRRWPLRFGLRTLLLLAVPVSIVGTIMFNARPLAWIEYSDARLDSALASGRPVILSFRYEWDMTSAIVEEHVLPDRRFKNAVRWHRYVPLRVECSNPTRTSSCAMVQRRFDFLPGSHYFAVVDPKAKDNLVVLEHWDAKSVASELNTLLNDK